MSNEVRAWENYEKKDEDYKTMRLKYNNPHFYEEYNLGFDDYVNGDWKNAKSHFHNAEVNYFSFFLFTTFNYKFFKKYSI